MYNVEPMHMGYEVEVVEAWTTILSHSRETVDDTSSFVHLNANLNRLPTSSNHADHRKMESHIFRDDFSSKGERSESSSGHRTSSLISIRRAHIPHRQERKQ